jgi:hypothetical protein
MPRNQQSAMTTFEYTVGEVTGKCRALDIDGAFRSVLNKLYGRSYGWLPEGRHDNEPDIYGRVWYCGYATRWSRKANAHSIESPLLIIKIRL